MYQRYSRMGDSGSSRTQVRRNRIKTGIILLLIAMVAALGVIGIPAFLARQDQRTLYVQRIQSECDDALKLTASLSRNAGADSAAILARIRSNIYAIRTVSSLSASSGFHPLVDEDVVMTLQNLVDRYLSYITTGMDTGEYQTNLQNALASLQESLRQLE